MVEQYDVAVIGAGPGGYPAAIRAAQLGFKTVCIDKRSTLGGTCLNVGCIPSKALLQSTELLAHLRSHGGDFGIEVSGLNVNFDKMTARKERVVKELTDGIGQLFQRNGVTRLQGEAQFIDEHRLKVIGEAGESEIEARFVIVATGSEPIELSAFPFDGKTVISSTEALALTRIPQTLCVVGGGVIGVELASVYSRLGTKVTVVEMTDRLCPTLDRELSKHLLRCLEKQGIEFLLSSRVESATIRSEEVVVTVERAGALQTRNASILLVAVGRRPYTTGLKLENAGIRPDGRGFIPADGCFRTEKPHIFAVGDAIEGTMLAHRASSEGVAVVEFLKDRHPTVDYLSVPNVVYTDPEIATVGLTEEEVDDAGIDKIAGKAFFRGNPRARCMGEQEGFVKILGDKRSGRLIGLHIIGPHASEMISEGMLAVQRKVTVRELAEASQAHPTLSEAIKEAALDALGEAIHH